MFALIAIGLSLAVLVVLLRLKVKLGLSMVIAACSLAVLLGVGPAQLGRVLVDEWRDGPLRRTTGYLFVSLTALLLLVNVIGEAMTVTGISQRLVPAMQGLFRSRRFGLALIPMIMGMLPTPGGIMLSAPMVREAGDRMGVDRSRVAAINFLFRHVWEPIWPLFPAIPLIQTMLGISAMRLFCHHAALSAAGIAAGAVSLLLFGIPPRRPGERSSGRLGGHVRDFLHAFWPIVFTAVLYVVLDVPPAVGVALSIFGMLVLHRVPVRGWPAVFRAGADLNMVLLISGALLFKLNLEASGAIGDVVEFFAAVNMPPHLVLFLLPFVVSFSTGVTMASVAIAYPFLLGFIGTGEAAKVGLETLAFGGVMFGLWTSPIHLCFALSASYFEAPLWQVIRKVVPGATAVAAAGFLTARLLG